ncbi:hypothetical protein Tco_0707143 [Tanacetum coccineum]|uniref:Uncharacterized protein n=1 Tax=Tanacetum coccineum TaxID=301880 RepID=A0ABQ4YAZ5_9ASTR
MSGAKGSTPHQSLAYHPFSKEILIANGRFNSAFDAEPLVFVVPSSMRILSGIQLWVDTLNIRKFQAMAYWARMWEPLRTTSIRSSLIPQPLNLYNYDGYSFLYLKEYLDVGKWACMPGRWRILQGIKRKEEKVKLTERDETCPESTNGIEEEQQEKPEASWPPVASLTVSDLLQSGDADTKVEEEKVVNEFGRLEFE